MHPPVKDKPISEKRKDTVIKNILQTVKSESLIRNILNQKPAIGDTNPFFKLGVNLIIDKIWFVDNPGGDSYYAYEELGYSEGKSIANGETKGVLEEILNVCNLEENQIKKDDELNDKYIDEAIFKLVDKGHACEYIITNLIDEFKFWHMPNFQGNKGGKRLQRFEGQYKGIPVYWSNFLPKGLTILFDKKALGDFVIKKDIYADIREIEKTEEEAILKALPELRGHELSEKVRLYAEEIVRFEIKNKSAVIFLYTKPSLEM